MGPFQINVFTRRNVMDSVMGASESMLVVVFFEAGAGCLIARVCAVYFRRFFEDWNFRGSN